MRVYYFGVRDTPGHYLWRPGGWCCSIEESPLPWKAAEMDGGLCPLDPYQEEGMAKLHYKDGWTALAFWDRSGDTRVGSNSVFFVDKICDEKEVIIHGMVAFPRIWARIRFDIRLFNPRDSTQSDSHQA